MRKPIVIAAVLGLGLSGTAAFATPPGEPLPLINAPAETAAERVTDSGATPRKPVEGVVADSEAAPVEEAETEVASLATADAFVNQQGDDQLLADDLLGKTVFNEQNENVGDVNDLLFDKNGQVAAVVIGVGGFLGIGEKDVAVRFEAIDILQEADNGAIVIVDGSREMLEAAPDFTTLAQLQAEINALPRQVISPVTPETLN